MLSSNYNGIGIGHVVVGGWHFWAQALGRTDDGHGTETAAVQGTRSVPVELKTAYMTDVTAQADPSTVTVDVGMSRELPQAAITFRYDDPENWPGGVVFSAKAHPSWTVKKTSVARIENGLLRGVAVGSTKLTATVYGNAVSASVVCENLGTPSVTAQPADASGYANSNVTFSVEASGRELSYKWEYKKTASAASWTTWGSGQTLTVAVKEARNGYLFRCRITDVYGNQVTSAAAKLTVKPKITAQPKAVSAYVGATAQFSVTATGAGLQYRWQVSKDEGETWKNVTDQNEGYNTSVLKLKVKDAWNGYRYRCRIEDANGKSVRSTGVKLTVKPKITSQPAAVSAYVGSTAVFTVKATGAGLQYRWQVSKDEGATWKDVTSANEGYNKATLKPVVKDSWNGYRYRCRITDANGKTLYSAGAELTVKPKITSQPAAASARAGETVSFTVKATGAELQYRWYVSTDGGQSWKKVSTANEGYNESTLKLVVKTAWNGYRYRCAVTDANGKTIRSTGAELTVR